MDGFNVGDAAFLVVDIPYIPFFGSSVTASNFGALSLIPFVPGDGGVFVADGGEALISQ